MDLQKHVRCGDTNIFFWEIRTFNTSKRSLTNEEYINLQNIIDEFLESLPQEAVYVKKKHIQSGQKLDKQQINK